MKNGYFHIAALFCIILLNFIFFYRKKVKNIETKLYGYMLISSLIDTILELTVLIIATIKYDDSSMIIIKILNKIDFIHFIIWPFLLLLYVVCITKNKSTYKKFVKIGSIISLIAIITELLLPINLINEGESMGVSGACTSFILAIVFIFVILTVSITLFNLKKAPNKKYLPIYMLLLMIIIGAIVRTINPTLLIMPAITVYIDLIMFFYNRKSRC